MTLTSRDKRALVIWAVGIAALAIYWTISNSGTDTAVANATGSIQAAEKRLERVRKLAGAVAGREEVLKQVSAELADREKGLIQAETSAQALAQLMEAVRRTGRAQMPPLEFSTMEIGQQIVRQGEDYGQIQVTVPFTCQIDALVNFIADLGRQPEALATTELRIAAADPKQKTINVRLTVAGLVPKRLVPQQKKGIF